MYCTKCGEKNNDTAIYCGKCGDKLIDEGGKSQSTTNEEAIKESVEVKGRRMERVDLYKRLIQKNSDYYINEFEKIERGEKSSFNWSILFFSPIIMLYRKCYNIFFKFIAPLQIISFINMIIAKTAVMNLQAGTIAMVSIFNIILGIASIGMSIYLGFNFNRLYKARLDKIIYTQRLEEAEDTYSTKALIRKYGGNSVVPIIIMFIVTITISIIIEATGSVVEYDDYSYKEPKKSTVTQVSYKNDIEQAIVGAWQMENGGGTLAITSKTFAENPYRVIDTADNRVDIEVTFGNGTEKLRLTKQDNNKFIILRYNEYNNCYTAPTTIYKD